MKQVIERLAQAWQGADKIAFLGVGNPLRADDSVGLFLVDEIQKQLEAASTKQLRFYLGESAPENFSGAIREFAPDVLFIFDAAEFDAEPGQFRLIECEDIGGASFCTHMLPLHILANYLITTAGCTVVVVGVQPQYLEFAYPLSQVVEKAAALFVREFVRTVTAHGN
jgi:hydrogenase 3 maturation protease